MKPVTEKPLQVSAAFAKIAELADALKVCSITKLPGCWEHRIDDNWFIAVNAHLHECRTEDAPGGNLNVLAGGAYIEFNGWPVGFITPCHGGVMRDAGKANEDTFIAALDAAIEVAFDAAIDAAVADAIGKAKETQK